MATTFRVQNDDLDPGRAQDFGPASLVSAARLHHRPADPVCLAPTKSTRPRLQACFEPQSADPAERMQASTLLLATSRPTMRVCCGILPVPSLLVRALTPMQLFGFQEDARPVPRFPAGFSCGGHGLRSSDGRLHRTTARSPTLSHLADTRWPHRASREPSFDGLWGRMGCGKQGLCPNKGSWCRSRNPAWAEAAAHTPSGASRHLPQQAGDRGPRGI